MVVVIRPVWRGLYVEIQWFCAKNRSQKLYMKSLEGKGVKSKYMVIPYLLNEIR